MRKLIAVTLIALALSCTKPKAEMYRKSENLMHTLVSVTVVADSPEKAERAINSAFDEIKSLETRLSFWTRDSEIAAIANGAGKSPVKVSSETMEIINHALVIARLTGGAFDPTIGPVMRTWDFKAQRLPAQAELQAALPLVGYRMMKVDVANMTAYLEKPGMGFDTGGIAKGYAADKAVERLKADGITGGIVAVAGDVRAFGRKPDGSSWSIGIRDPRSDSPDALMASFDLDDRAVSTSGDYERFFFKDGKRYQHILNPSTGMPAEGTISATVIAPAGVMTDGLSTGIFVMGPDKGFRLLTALGFDGVIVRADGSVLVTPALEQRIRWTSGQKPTIK